MLSVPKAQDRPVCPAHLGDEGIRPNVDVLPSENVNRGAIAVVPVEQPRIALDDQVRASTPPTGVGPHRGCRTRVPLAILRDPNVRDRTARQGDVGPDLPARMVK